jgi:hypothetical protein
LRWAKGHTQKLTSDIDKWLADYGNNPIGIAKTYDPQVRCFSFRFAGTLAVSPDWSLIVGDALHNFRSALDYLAWQLVDVGTEPKPVSSKLRIYFPIIVRWKETQTPRQAFDALSSRYLPGVDPTFVGIIERYQPYKWIGAQPETHPFSLLSRLSNHDKHQQLQITSVLHHPFGFQTIEVTNCEITEMLFNRTTQFERNAEIMKVHVALAGTGEPEVKMGIGITPVVVIRDEFLAVSDVVGRISAMTETLLTEFSTLI